MPKPSRPARCRLPNCLRTIRRTTARIAWWREAKFGMFIHWGLYSTLAGEWQGKEIPGNAEWIMAKAKIPMPEYENLAGQFNPVKFDAEEWVRLAKDAGMKYVVFVAKHHDGFAMYDSKVDDFNIVSRTPWKRDPAKELAEACARHQHQVLRLLLAQPRLA